MIKCINILVADHSSYARLVLSDILHADAMLKVISTCIDGDDLVSKVESFNPDVILMDAGLPKSERLFSLKRIGNNTNIPVIVIGSAAQLNDKFIQKAGAVGITNYIVLPDNLFHRDLRQLSEDIIKEVKHAFNHKSITPSVGGSPHRNFESLKSIPEVKGISLFTRQKKNKPSHIIVIGASTGGPQAIETVLKDFPSSFTGCILIAQHMPAGFTRTFAERLNAVCNLTIIEGEHGMRLEAGTVIIAPGDLHMVIKPVMGSSDNFRIEFSENEGDLFDRPSIDMLMSSVAKAYGDKAIGVILSGMGSDGAQGVRKMSQYGGLTVVQDQQSALIFGMGKAACETGCVNTVLPLSDINSYIRSRVTSDSLKSVEV